MLYTLNLHGIEVYVCVNYALIKLEKMKNIKWIIVIFVRCDNILAMHSIECHDNFNIKYISIFKYFTVRYTATFRKSLDFPI